MEGVGLTRLNAPTFQHVARTLPCHHQRPSCQVNLEYVALENRVISTEQDSALQDVFGDGVGSSMYKQAIASSARRLATIFATLRVRVYAGVVCAFY